MKKSFTFLTMTALLAVILPIQVLAEATVYIPNKNSSQYLPTVKIHTFSQDYTGGLSAQSLGSGTLVDAQGHVITNNHVIEEYYDTTQTYDALQICLTKANNVEEPICNYTANLVARNQTLDIAILKIEDTDVMGNAIDFNFYLPYQNDADPAVGDSITAVGYPDTGGKTMTVTQGIVSGFLNQNNISYIKTDADISSGNSGGTAINSDGKFIGIPTAVSVSLGSLGYLLPINNMTVQNWISSNINNEIQSNTVANEQLKKEILTYITANETGQYDHTTYPNYSITIADGWKVGNELEGAFEGEELYNYSFGFGDTVSFYPVEKNEESLLSLSVSISDFGYEIDLDDIVYQIEQYNWSGEALDYEEVMLNGKYPAIKQTESYTDWWYTDGEVITTISHYIPYGDKLISIYHYYSSSEADRLPEIKTMLDSLDLDMNAIKYTNTTEVENSLPYIKVSKPANIDKDIYLSDNSYEWNGVNYFGAIYSKKRNEDFFISLYLNELYDDEYIGDFKNFEKNTMSYVDQSSLISKANLTIDGHDGFYYISEYDEYGYETRYMNIYLEVSPSQYLSIYYSNERDQFNDYLSDLSLILRNIQMDNLGNGRYLIPNFLLNSKKTLSDIENHVYESNIRQLYEYDVLGDLAPEKFNPENNLSRQDFVTWAVRSLADTEDYMAFEETYTGCSGTSCFADFDYNSSEGIYIYYAQKKDAIKGQEIDGQKYFNPEANLSLMAAYKIIFELYDEYEVWSIPESLDLPWYTPYLLLAYKENLIPYGVSEIDHQVKRGEGAYIVDQVMNSDDELYYY